ncbi:hypothetical protein GS501_00055 [Saccharibacter sp. 17.LH.SD]|uniref:hypothetical protein n=1 Tax=Saccharibacter sp. 17.LH.SD TaxID=2689393 RepID=UPI00136B1CE3|nr:hypothetical protein [Saccharibacter sp. 17.LH.SD]MXV43473.1 hypothetical protein [Saccharibacter sp. 17.LH.SD]
MSRKRETFQSVLTQAVEDLRRNGYDSKARHQRWLRKLRQLAKRMVGSDEESTRRVKRVLQASYTQKVTKGSIAKEHQISVYTVKQLSPSLQRELARRIAAATELITLNKDRAVEQTLQRFSGWATAQNPGMTTPEKVREIKAQISKPLYQQPFEERRTVIDQNAKFSANLNYLVASDNKAIAVIWDANASRPNYHHRPEHLARNGKIFVLKDSWAYQNGYIKKDVDFYEDTEGFATAPFCSCKGIYLYSLTDLPEEMLTEKGLAAVHDIKNGKGKR